MKAEVKARKKTPQESCNTPKDFFRYSEAATRGVM